MVCRLRRRSCGLPRFSLAPDDVPKQHRRANIEKTVGQIENRPVAMDDRKSKVQPIPNGEDRLTRARIGELPSEPVKTETVVEIPENASHAE